MWGVVFLIGAITAAAPGQTPPEDYHNLPRMQGWYRGEPVTFRVYQGQALVQGDMLLGPVDQLLQPPEAPPGTKDSARASVARSGDRFRWTDRTIPYEIDTAMPNQQRVLDAIEEWNTKTVLKMKPREAEANYVRFARVGSGCSASVGMIGGRQLINLADNCSRGNTIHEIGHAVGLFHTQSRSDRTAFVSVLYENITRAQWDQFDQVAALADDVGPYDYGAVMHYGPVGFNATPRNTIQSIPPGIPLGQRTGLSQAEIQAVARLYGEPVAEVVIDSFPTGLMVVVDGQSYRAPKSFAWAPGETHTVQAQERIATTSPNVEYRFARWSDNGPAEHTITSAAGGAVFVANYAQYVRLRTGAAPQDAGQVEVSPESPDGFYPLGTLVLIRARPAEGQRFFRWIAGAGGVTFLAANEQGNGSNPVEFSIRTGAEFYVANFLDRDFTIIDSTSKGTLLTVDGQQVFAPVHLDWAAGSSHTVAVEATRTNSDAGIRYQFRGWSNEAEREQRITVDAPLTLKADVAVQYRVDKQVFSSRAAGTPAPGLQNFALSPEGDRWYDDGTQVEIRAVELEGLPLSNWVYDAGGKTNPQTILINGPAAIGANFIGVPVLNSLSAVNDASQQPVAVAPATLFTLYTPGIGGDSPVEAQPDGNGAYPAELGGVAVLVGTERAGVVRLAKGAVTVITPATLPAGKTITVAVDSEGRRRGLVVPLQFAAPGVYTRDGTGRGQAVAANGDGSANSAGTPAGRGDTLRVLVTGLAGGPLSAEIGGLPAEVLSLRPERPGRAVMELRIPADTPVGPAVSLIVAAGGARSQVTATVAIR